MGLCKCPKRKVTNLYCFEHKVNVCEHCLVSNHPKCMVQSYLQWLKDADYNPICTICSQNLNDERYGDCVRLLCYDLFHWGCLNAFASRLPATTAPAGYQCPNCKDCILPASNVVSPVADKLRDYLTRVNWARSALSLPPLEEQDIPAQLPTVDPSQSRTSTPGVGNTSGESLNSKPVNPVQPTVYSQSGDGYTQPHVFSRTNEQSSVAGGRSGNTFDPPRSGYNQTATAHTALNMSDHDTDKYKRRSALSFLSTWFRSRDITSGAAGGKRAAGPPVSIQKRFFLIIGLGMIGFITLMLILSRLSRGAADDDPTLEMLNNPNVRVGNQ